MHKKEIRWKQRFQNFKKAFRLLQKYIDITNPNELERADLIQFFEMAFELSRKLMKDYQESVGFVLQCPRDCFKQALQSNLIDDGHIWFDALNDRNITAHTYDEETALKIIEVIKTKYFPEMEKFYDLMVSKI